MVESRTLTKILRNPADKITWFASGFFHDPGQQRGGGRFSVRASDHEIVAAAEEIIFQNFREREIEKFPVQDRFYLRIAALHRVADYDNINIGRNIFRAIAFLEGDAFLFQKN